MYFRDIASTVHAGNLVCGAEYDSELHAFRFIDVLNSVSRL